jgi:hypothetical protein
MQTRGRRGEAAFAIDGVEDAQGVEAERGFQGMSSFAADARIACERARAVR